MTIFRYDVAPPGLLSAFFDPRQNWFPGEIHTLTGFDQSEFAAALEKSEAVEGDDLLSMLRQAANTLLGLPSTSIDACSEHIGAGWPEQLKAFLERTSNLEVKK